ncbi:trypsin-like peptidase domain-containing protein [Fructobacillus sp. M1-13]|uniref:Serine protease n=1 Tax=Fructobacillus papyriferae TaxID=2713171 RepID=A0ABS5QNA4_9LACO|nr:trypsin-like peptidase domain-containing protein [Fructobacillus papyriferae]MBS9334570.1 trypsin-like serine protease [Fructobacillus papyriferae]MCD2158559.1 trypsin-like peptidase domain-containing protein [Fructobacillus papyriferae]
MTLTAATILSLGWTMDLSTKAYVFDSAKFQKGRVPDTRQAPFSSVVLIVNQATGDSGSGVLIGPDTVLTAAHVAMSEQAGASQDDWPTRVTNPSDLIIEPAYGGQTGSDGERYPFGQHYQGAAISVPPRYLQDALNPYAPEADPGDHDVALIHLSRPIPNAEVLPLGELRAQDIDQELISAVGFPATLGPGSLTEPENQNDSMYVDSGYAESISTNQLTTRQVNWSHGSSGGPILNRFNQVVGIVSSSNSNGNYATRITPELNCWIQEAMVDVTNMLTSENVANRWVSFGRERVFFDDQSTARQMVSDEPTNLGVLDLSIPGTSGNVTFGHHDEL